MHRITYSPDLHLLEIAIEGFFDASGVAAFARAVAQALAEHATSTPPACLYDYSKAAIQSQSVVALLQQLARKVPANRRIALYTDGRLARMQARRIAAECPTMLVFDDRASAIAWLRAPATAAAA